VRILPKATPRTLLSGVSSSDIAKELFTVHFPDSTLTEDSNGGQGQQNLDYSKAQRTGNTETWPKI
jgi:hypothetical protein